MAEINVILVHRTHNVLRLERVIRRAVTDADGPLLYNTDGALLVVRINGDVRRGALLAIEGNTNVEYSLYNNNRSKETTDEVYDSAKTGSGQTYIVGRVAISNSA